MALLALLVGVVSLRTSGMYFIMITLAFAQMLYYFFVSLEVYGGDDGLSIAQRNRLPSLDLENEAAFYYVCLLILVVFLLMGGGWYIPGSAWCCRDARRTNNGCWPSASPCTATSWRPSSWPGRQRALRARSWPTTWAS